MERSLDLARDDNAWRDLVRPLDFARGDKIKPMEEKVAERNGQKSRKIVKLT